MIHLHIRKQAERDLRGIADYIAEDNRPRAISFVMELKARIDALKDFPLSAPLAIGLKRPIRRVPHGSYVIYYVLLGQKLEVLRIVHAARNTEALEFGEIE